jgi:alkylation response protein AidB-like acyl-CoA dehydrogenase
MLSRAASALAQRAARRGAALAPAAARRGAAFAPAAAFLDPTAGLSADQAALYDAAHAFAQREVAPRAAAWDEASTFPEEALRAAAALGFASMWAAEEHGGSALSRADSLPVLEALARACPSFAAYLSIHGMVAKMIDAHGTPAQRARWGGALATASAFGSYCLTEPGAGSDAAALTTRAARDAGAPGGWALSGQKAFISGGGRSDVYVVMARSGGAGAGGVSAFLVERGARGLSYGANEKKMGWKCQPTAAVYFDGTPAELLGVEGGGFKMAMAALDGGRLSIGACSVGAAAAALDAARAHVLTRSQFGAPLAAQQAVAFEVADMAAGVWAARAAVRAAGAALDAGAPGARAQCALAKAAATERALAVVDAALQLHGGYGYLQATGIEKLLRDVRVHTILEGASGIMRVVLARAVLEGR